MPDAPAVTASALEVRALGVQGFMLTHGHDSVMTAPLFTRQSAIQVTFNVPLQADAAAIDAGLAGLPLHELRAVVSGHAHYDHFMDVPRVLETAPGGRRSGQFV
jgi:L-ascorbate metabolism protein UlaG (beta-lactamase superfamily)